MIGRKLQVALGALALSLSSAVVHAEPLGSHQPHLEASLGARVSKVADAGYDPFADSDELAQVSLGLGGTLFAHDRFSLAAVGFWDYGTHSGEARGAQTSLVVHRLSAGPELRYQLIPPLYVFVHALPAFAHSAATLDDGVAAATRSAEHWSYGLDGAAGAAVEIYGKRSGESWRPRLWVIAEGGYGYLGSTRLSLKAKTDAGAPERTAPIDLGSLSLAGPYVRVSAAVSF
jgi:hypothetical protein